MTDRPQKVLLAENANKPDDRTREALRKRLIEMIRRSEVNRREKAR